LDPLWGNSSYVSFPFFSWIFYPLVGVYLGNHLIRAKDKSIYYKGLAFAGLILLVFGLLVSVTDIDTHVGDYWRHSIGGNLWITGFVLVWWAFLYLLMEKITLPPFLLGRVNFWSKKVTSLYFIHWIIIGWGTLLLGFEDSSLFSTIILMVVFIFLSDRLTYAWTLVRRN
jgi:surface polysaccharide O-acyltransferase-like enzyme